MPVPITLLWMSIPHGGPHLSADSPGRAVAPSKPPLRMLGLPLCSGDGKIVAAGGEDDLVMLWDCEDQSVIGWCEGHASWVRLPGPLDAEKAL